MKPKQKFISGITSTIATLVKTNANEITIILTDKVIENPEGSSLHSFSATVNSEEGKEFSGSVKLIFSKRKDDTVPLAPVLWDDIEKQINDNVVLAHLFEFLKKNYKEVTAESSNARVIIEYKKIT